MQRKLRCIFIGEDPLVEGIFKKYFKGNEYADISKTN
jgi:hypothetical protein